VLFISSESSLRERPPLPAVGILARDDNLEIGRETEKKDGNDLKQLRVQTKCHWPDSHPKGSSESPLLGMRTREGIFGKQVGLRLLSPEHISSHLSVPDEARSTRAATNTAISYDALVKRVPKGGLVMYCLLMFAGVCWCPPCAHFLALLSAKMCDCLLLSVGFAVRIAVNLWPGSLLPQ